MSENKRKGFLPAWTWRRGAVVFAIAMAFSWSVWKFFTSIAPLPAWAVRGGISEWLMRNWVLGIGPALILLTWLVVHFGLTKMPKPAAPPIQYPLRPELRTPAFWARIDADKEREQQSVAMRNANRG